MNAHTVRAELPEMPSRIALLHVDERGYPVPWFVGWVDEDGNEVARGEGKADHRMIRGNGVIEALERRICWVCGVPLGGYLTFPVGPMCAVNRVTAEPPSHLECARFSVKGCPFLSRPHAHRREAGLPETIVNPAGTMLRRNPGVTALWTTRSFRPFRAPGGFLLKLGDPADVEWWREGRAATRDEVIESLDSGLPALADMAKQDGDDAVAELGRMVETAYELLPAPLADGRRKETG